MYMANATFLGWGPNATYIPLACVRGNTHFMFCAGGKANFSVFIYQHVGIGNTKSWCWGCYPTPAPDAKGMASQWNIGLTEKYVIFRVYYWVQCDWKHLSWLMGIYKYHWHLFIYAKIFCWLSPGDDTGIGGGGGVRLRVGGSLLWLCWLETDQQPLTASQTYRSLWATTGPV